MVDVMTVIVVVLSTIMMMYRVFSLVALLPRLVKCNNQAFIEHNSAASVLTVLRPSLTFSHNQPCEPYYNDFDCNITASSLRKL